MDVTGGFERTDLWEGEVQNLDFKGDFRFQNFPVDFEVEAAGICARLQIARHQRVDDRKMMRRTRRPVSGIQHIGHIFSVGIGRIARIIYLQRVCGKDFPKMVFQSSRQNFEGFERSLAADGQMGSFPFPSCGSDPERFFPRDYWRHGFIFVEMFPIGIPHCKLFDVGDLHTIAELGQPQCRGLEAPEIQCWFECPERFFLIDLPVRPIFRNGAVLVHG